MLGALPMEAVSNADDSPRESVQPKSGALAYVVQVYDKNKLSSPMLIPPDSSRQFIGIYLQNGSQCGIATPTLGMMPNGITVVPNEPNFEMRYSSHGPMVRDGWTIDAVGLTDMIMIVTISPDGG